MRAVWDPDEKYALYSFVRQAQTFPDVLLEKQGDETPLLGIELKGWYLLAKEGEPSLRFVATPAVCAAADLIAVYPWHLSETISGTPKLLTPWVEVARYVAEYRNHHWEYLRQARGTAARGVVVSAVAQPYPAKSDQISDKAEADGGGNFGRIARTGVMEAFVAEARARRLSGIPADNWRGFLAAFSDASTEATIRETIARLRSDLSESGSADEDQVEDLLEKLRRVAEVLRS